MIRRPPRSTQSRSSAASDVYKRQLVYSVCSFEPEETIDVINKFKNIRKFALENPLPFLFNKEYFVSLPFETGMDGFFIARLKKL